MYIYTLYVNHAWLLVFSHGCEGFSPFSFKVGGGLRPAKPEVGNVGEIMGNLQHRVFPEIKNADVCVFFFLDFGDFFFGGKTTTPKKTKGLKCNEY